jgi:hypothetical protein
MPDGELVETQHVQHSNLQCTPPNIAGQNLFVELVLPEVPGLPIQNRCHGQGGLRARADAAFLLEFRKLCYDRIISSHPDLIAIALSVVPHLPQDTCVQVRPLVGTGRHQQPPIAASLDGQGARAAVPLTDQVLSTRLHTREKNKYKNIHGDGDDPGAGLAAYRAAAGHGLTERHG